MKMLMDAIIKMLMMAESTIREMNSTVENIPTFSSDAVQIKIITITRTAILKIKYTFSQNTNFIE